ncbi:hypothetical protein DSO57_1018115 [Entomophthora muscae]|uniref:Uncharacterized protein n=1 Tax=Entomophthora muscae TaxID=34485 RepID=A0ACC2SHQ4_9FUNG|nr:hypothetical protein DSO57_1018115 [Entomophthora muscae]
MDLPLIPKLSYLSMHGHLIDNSNKRVWEHVYYPIQGNFYGDPYKWPLVLVWTFPLVCVQVSTNLLAGSACKPALFLPLKGWLQQDAIQLFRLSLGPLSAPNQPLWE